MVREQRLLERLEAWAREGPSRYWALEPKKLQASIQNHIQQILNTRQGSVLADPHYGLSSAVEMFEHFTPSLGDQLAKELRETILRYERRLSNVWVVYDRVDPAAGTIQCHIAGEVKALKEPVKINLTTILTTHGHAIVKM